MVVIIQSHDNKNQIYNVKIIFTRKAIEFYVLIMKKFYLI